MQVIEIFLRPGEGKRALEIIRDIGLEDFNLVESPTNDLVIIEHPQDKADKVLDYLQAEFDFAPGGDRSILIYTPDVILPKDRRKEKKFENKASREAIIAFAEESSEADKKFFALFFLSTVVAALGLLADNVAVVVGAMIIAPAFGPLASASAGIVLGRLDLFRKGVRAETAGVFLAVFTAALLAMLIPGLNITESLRLRMYPTLMDLFVALASGAAGAYSLSKGGKGASIVGVMVAAALVPTMAAVGIGLVTLNPLLVFGAFLLLAVNIVSIILSMSVVFWFLLPATGALQVKYSYKLAEVNFKRTVKYSLILILLMSIPLTWITYENIIFSRPEVEVRNVLSDPELSWNLKLAGIDVEENSIRVSVYSYTDTVPSHQLMLAKNLIEQRIDPRFSIEFEIIKAEHLTFRE